MKHQHIHPEDLIFIQSRAGMSEAIVAEYAELMTDDDFDFDPVEALEDDAGQVFVWDGSHRGAAARQHNRHLLVNLKPGTREEAEWLALSANQKHGLRRSREDKQYVIRQALLHPEGAGRSDREIGRHCGVDHKTVGRMRLEMEVSGEIPRITERTVTRNGVTYQQEVAGTAAVDDDLPDWLQDDEEIADEADIDAAAAVDDDDTTAERTDGPPPVAAPPTVGPATPAAAFERNATALPPQPRQRILKFAQVNQGAIALDVTLYINGDAHSLPATTMFAHGPVAGLPESAPEEATATLILPYETARRLNLVYLDNVVDQ